MLLEKGDLGRTQAQILRYLEAIAPGVSLLSLLKEEDPSLQALAAREATQRVQRSMVSARWRCEADLESCQTFGRGARHNVVSGLPTGYTVQPHAPQTPAPKSRRPHPKKQGPIRAKWHLALVAGSAGLSRASAPVSTDSGRLRLNAVIRSDASRASHAVQKSCGLNIDRAIPCGGQCFAACTTIAVDRRIADTSAAIASNPAGGT